MRENNALEESIIVSQIMQNSGAYDQAWDAHVMKEIVFKDPSLVGEHSEGHFNPAAALSEMVAVVFVAPVTRTRCRSERRTHMIASRIPVVRTCRTRPEVDQPTYTTSPV